MFVRWTTAGDDPRLLRLFPATFTVAVAATAVDGVPVLVTTSDDVVEEDDAETVLQIWHAGTGELLREVPGVGGDSLVVTELDRRPVAVTCGWSDTPWLVDLLTGSATPLPGAGDVVQGLAIAGLEGGPALVTADLRGQVRVVDLAARETVRVLDAGGDRLNAVAVLSWDGHLAAFGAGDALHAWDLHTGSPIATPPISGRACALATWPDVPDRLAVLGMDGSVEIAGRAVLGVPWRRWATHLAGLVTPDGRRLLAIADDEAVTLWDVEADRAAGPVLAGPTGWADVRPGEPGEVITASPEDRAVAVWAAGADLPPIGHGATSTITALTLSPDGRVIAGASDGTVAAWSLADGSFLSAEDGAVHGPVRAVATVEVDGRIEVLAGGGDVNGSPDDVLHRLPLSDGVVDGVIADQGGEIRVIAMLGTTAYTAGCDRTIARIDLVTGTRTSVIPGDNHASGIAIRGGRAAVSRFPGPFQLWDLAADRPIPTGAVDSAEFGERVVGWCGDGRVVVALDDQARVRDLSTGETTALDEGGDGRITAIASSDTLVAIARADCSLSVVDPSSGDETEALTLAYPATALAWTQEGDLIAGVRRDLVRWGLSNPAG
ncbi:WD40 repeat domain-containing protein [Actinoplanes sp. NPDC051470]|uniref:WD40 repeat domain-containing protein n=1 Tax=Actinoplanes sp. NPDC051470 TaxID=3157224 RepID=UPI00344A252C